MSAAAFMLLAAAHVTQAGTGYVGLNAGDSSFSYIRPRWFKRFSGRSLHGQQALDCIQAPCGL
jgi:hypothetical protein